jgi:protein-disulfide isomerase
LLWAAGGAALGAAAARFLPLSRGELFRSLVDDPAFLADHPDLISAAQSLEDVRREDQDAAGRRALLDGEWKSRLHPAYAPQLGARDGAVLLVDFTDYLCAPCRASAPILDRAVWQSGDIRAVVMLVPVSGALSDYTAALAAACYFTRPPQFQSLHATLMRGGAPAQDRIDEAVISAGYDIDAVRRLAAAETIHNYLTKARSLAELLGLSGVPALLTGGGRLLRGGMSMEALKLLIASERRDTKSNSKESNGA